MGTDSLRRITSQHLDKNTRNQMKNAQGETIRMARLCACVIIVGVAILIHSVAFGGWTYLAREEGVNYYIKPESITHAGTFVRGWVKIEYQMDDKDGRRVVERHVEVDCFANKYRLIRFVTYYRNGEIKRHESLMYDWKYAFSFSMSDRAMTQKMCTK